MYGYACICVCVCVCDWIWCWKIMKSVFAIKLYNLTLPIRILMQKKKTCEKL